MTITKKEKDLILLQSDETGREYAITKTGGNWVVSAECEPDMFVSTSTKACIRFVEQDNQFYKELNK